jgi:hypothetical protein
MWCRSTKQRRAARRRKIEVRENEGFRASMNLFMAAHKKNCMKAILEEMSRPHRLLDSLPEWRPYPVEGSIDWDADH